MTIRTALVATMKLLRNVAADRAPRPEPRHQASPGDRFERRQLGNADSGGGDPKGGTQIGW